MLLRGVRVGILTSGVAGSRVSADGLSHSDRLRQTNEEHRHSGGNLRGTAVLHIVASHLL
ncbi:hypothetical protein D3C80_2227220 [compost metagenome]